MSTDAPRQHLRSFWYLPYALFLVGAILFMLRRLLLPTSLELEGVPFDIGLGSVLNLCYSRPSLAACSDPVIVTLTVFGVALTAARGSVGRSIFALIMLLLPLGLYFAYSPLWLWLGLLLLLPLLLDLGVRWLIPRP